MRELIAIRANASANVFWLSALRLQALFAKGGFNPNQPRIPRGQREGGRWTRGGDPHAPTPPPKLEFDDEGQPKLPEERPPQRRDPYLLARQIAVWLLRHSASIESTIQVLRGTLWIHSQIPSILSYLDAPRTLWELQKRALDNPTSPPGYELHHIVEQKAGEREGFRDVLIQGWENRVLIPRYRHLDINGWFMRANPEFDDLSPREYLRNKSYEEHRRVGLRALRDLEVLKP